MATNVSAPGGKELSGKAIRLRFMLSCYAIILLPVVLLTIFIYLPVYWGFSKSLFEFEVGAEQKWVGLGHFKELLFQDPVTWVSVLNMFILTLFAIAAQLSMPLIVAKLIHSLHIERWRYMYRILFMVPIVVPGVAVQLIWAGMIFNDSGMLNSFLDKFGIPPQGWLGDAGMALICVAFVGFPWVSGFNVLIYYAGLTNISESVNEAAKLEGCVGVNKFFRIDVPMVMSQIKLILMLTIITYVPNFANLIILTQGGPGFRTMLPGLWMFYNAFEFQRMGYGCAIGVCLFVIVFTFTMLSMKYVRSTEQLEGRR